MVKVTAKRTCWTDYPLKIKITEAIFTVYFTAQRRPTNSLNVDLIKFCTDCRNFTDISKILSAPARGFETASWGMQNKLLSANVLYLSFMRFI